MPEKSRLEQRYLRDVVPTLSRDFNYTNPMQVPRLAKVTVNVGVGEAITNNKALDATVRDVSLATGQKPIVNKARGLEVSIVTTARTDQEARRLLELLGMPFQREGDTAGPPAATARRR